MAWRRSRSRIRGNSCRRDRGAANTSSPQQATQGLLGQFPSWYAPHPTSEAILSRNLFHSDWMIPIVLLGFVVIMNYLRSYTLGYFFFRLWAKIQSRQAEKA